jgi:hypothetical protein
MRRFKLVVLAAMALFAFGALASSAFGADEGTPRILCLSGEKCTELKGTFKGGASSLINLAGKTLTGTSSEFALSGCKEAGSTADTNLCEAKADFLGVKKGEVNCRSEAGTEKDPIETVLALLDLHVGAGEAESKLNPILEARVLGAKGEEELTIVCGTVKIKAKGTASCLLLPGLANIATTEEVTIQCKVNASNDLESDKCTVLCEWLTEKPLESTLNGSTFEDTAFSITAKGKLNKDIFIDD